MKKLILVLIIVAIGVGLYYYFKSKTENNTTAETKEVSDLNGDKVIYFAGGCFWGTERMFEQIPGVVDAVSGYANGDEGVEPAYENIDEAGYKEAVKVTYDSSVISLDALLYAYYAVIDPTVQNRQGNDVGSQYQTGIYYVDEEDGKAVSDYTEREKKKYDKFFVETEGLVNFYDAEDYHQNYLQKNPNGYCHISQKEMNEVLETLTVTQTSATEKPFDNKYWDENKRGIYVDVISGEPLFTSADKYDSSCGWPSFSRTLTDYGVKESEDLSHGMHRTEVRSQKGNSHLGHVFEGDSESPTGTRYCINSASLRFIPYADMDKEGYGEFKKLI